MKASARSTRDLAGTPFKLAEDGRTADTAAPVLGANTDAILAEPLGYAPDRIAAPRAAGAFTLG